MMYIWQTVKGSIEPLTLDVTSSRSTAYIRKNIELVESEEENEPSYYQYEEMQVPLIDLTNAVAVWLDNIAATREDVLNDGSVTQGGLVDIYLNQFEIISKLDELLEGQK